MEILAYLRILYRRLWLITMVAAAGTVAAGLWTWTQTPLYTTTTTLLLNPAAPSELVLPGAGLSAEPGPGVDRLARSYAEYLRTRAFGALVVERLGLQATPEDISWATSAALVPGTNFFRVTVTWDSRQEAQQIANGIAKIFIEENRRLQLQSRPSSATTLDLTASLSYYERRVKALRVERDEIEYSPRLSDRERRDRLAEIENRLQALEDTYVKLLSNTALAQANEERQLNTAIVIDPAPLPAHPSHPKKRQNVMLAGISSSAIGIALAILLEYLDSTVKTAQDVERVTGQGPLGLIALVKLGAGRQERWRRWLAKAGIWDLERGRPVQPRDPTAYQRALVTVHAPQSSPAEAFRALRTNVQLASVDRPVRSLVITSLTPGEGKSFVAANLAVVFAQSGQRVVLVDADLRRPSQHRIFGLANQVGLTSLMLAHDAAPEEGLQLTHVPGLAVMTSGPLPPNPSELLSSSRMAQVLERLRSLADMVILDSPPMTPVTDPVVLSARVDGTVLVAWSGHVRQEALQASVSRLQRLHCALLGVVLNGVTTSAMGAEYRYYREYYGDREIDQSPLSEPGFPATGPEEGVATNARVGAAHA